LLKVEDIFVLSINFLHLLVKLFYFCCKYISYQFIYLHEIVEVQNSSRKARGPDWNPSSAGLWGPLH